jgi:hypothetical protein
MSVCVVKTTSLNDKGALDGAPLVAEMMLRRDWRNDVHTTEYRQIVKVFQYLSVSDGLNP